MPGLLLISNNHHTKIAFLPSTDDAQNNNLSNTTNRITKSNKSVGPGFYNEGNTCFLNAVLQCLTYTPALADFAIKQNHIKSCQKANCILCKMVDLILQSIGPKTTSKTPIRPLGITSNLKRIAKHFKFGRQEDSHEFLRFLIEAMHSGASLKKNDESPIYSIFRGLLKSQIKCLSCKNNSDTFDPILDISLEITKCQCLTEALEKFTKPEVLTKGNRYKCESCNSLRDAQKQFSFADLPSSLAIHFKRFGFSRFGKKISNHIQFPEFLNMAPYVSTTKGKSKSEFQYALSGVLVHSGNSCGKIFLTIEGSGHYYAFIKGPTGKWYCMDDASVRQVSIQTVLSQQAYILFYSSRSETRFNEVKISNIITNGSNQVAESQTKAKQFEHRKNNFLSKSHEIEMSKNGNSMPQIYLSINSGLTSKPNENYSKKYSKKEPQIPKNSGRLNATSLWHVFDFATNEGVSKSDIKKTASASSKKISDLGSERGNVPPNSQYQKKIPSPEAKAADFNKMESFQDQNKSPNTSTLNAEENYKPDNMKSHTKIIESNNARPPPQNGNTNGPSRLESVHDPRDIVQETPVMAWTHIATSDMVFKRNNFLSELDKSEKRKRPSRDEM